MKRTAVYMLAATIVCMPRAAAAGDVEKGRKVAEAHCSRCHVVGDFNPTGGISSTPSFQLLATRRPDYKDRFATFYARRPHPAFVTVKGIGRPMDYLPPNAHPVEITLEDVENVSAFVETLKAKGPEKRR